jgi:hypothetical protein
MKFCISSRSLSKVCGFRFAPIGAVFLYLLTIVSAFATAPLPATLVGPGTSSPSGATAGGDPFFLIMLSDALNAQIEVTDLTTNTVVYQSPFVTFSNFGYK